MNVLEARHVTKTYIIENRSVEVLNDVSLAAEAGEFIVIEGTSGSGKTTLLALLSGLDRPTSGRIVFQERDITDASEDALAQIRNRGMGFVFQSYHLVPSLTALENIMFPGELAGNGHVRDRAMELVLRVGLQHRLSNFPHQLSGGEQQRVAICRALINRPPLIFADEPTGNLDSRNGQEVLQLLLDLRREHGSTLLLVTHNEAIARLADRVVTLQDGRVAR